MVGGAWWRGQRKNKIKSASTHGAVAQSPWSSSFPWRAAAAAYEMAMPGSALAIEYTGLGREGCGDRVPTSLRIANQIGSHDVKRSFHISEARLSIGYRRLL